VTRGWEDVVARVRGLSTHLFGRVRLGELARMRDLSRLAAALDEAFGPAVGLTAGSSAEQLEIAVRRAAARHLRIIARWSGRRAAYLAPLLLDEDRRSVRALLRGASAGSPPPERVAALVPTPTLPESALDELARQPSVGRVVALLTAWGHPFGSPLLDEARRSQPDLLRLDVLLNTEYAIRSIAAVRRAPRGDEARHDLVALVRETIDLENASTAMQLAEHRSGTDPAVLFMPEGRWLDRATFLAAATAPDEDAGLATLGRAFRGTSLAPVLAAVPRKAFEDAALSTLLRRALRAARERPLGAAPVIAFFVRLRAEVRDLRFIIWRVALGAPPPPADALLTIA